MTASSQHIVIEEFFQWEKEAQVEVVASLGSDEKTSFLPMQIVKSYFSANDHRKLNKILTDVFHTEYPPVDADLILRDHTAVFCILLHLGQAEQIEHFARYEELSDRRLPFDQTHPPRDFPSDSQDARFLKRFCEKQTAYCVPIFDSHMLHKHFGGRLLPIRSCKLQGLQHPANQYVIDIYGPYNKLLHPKSIVENPFSNTFLVNTYPKDHEAQYKQEIEGFRNVRHAESIVRFSGSYIHGDEYHLLLEYPDKGSLEEYFKRESPPNRGPDIVKFWDSLFSLLKGLKAIHSVRSGHHGVKPEAIVVVSNGAESISDWLFKFANVGISDAKLVAPQSQSATYAPPELYAPSHDDLTEKRSSNINWSADIWALGCIYSEAAVWIADGYKGLLEYRQQRAAETDRILFKGGDCFHDGERALQCVINAHADIEDRLRRSDHITKDVLDTMVDEMLWDEDRPNAKALCRKADMVLTRARQRMTANSADEYSRSGSAQSRAMSLPRTAPPTTPLPPLPQKSQGRMNLASISEAQYPPNVEKWRYQVGHLQINAPPRSHAPSEIASPTFPSQQTVSTESVSDFDREITGSIASWNFKDNASTITSPTQFSSPHAGVQPDCNNPNEGRPRILQTVSAYEYRSPPRKALSHLSYGSNPAPASNTFASAPPLSEHPAYSVPVMEPRWTLDPVANDTRPLRPLPVSQQDEPRPAMPNRANSRHSNTSSQYSDPPLRPKSSKRNGGFSLFPSRNWSSVSRRSADKDLADDTVPRTTDRSSFSSSTPSVPAIPDQLMSPTFEYLSLNTCIEWKKAHKKVKKNTKLPPLPGAHLIEDLKGRDHVFIVDDGASMAGLWPDVKRVFETLSYVVKGMSPVGTELFYAVSYDTYRRKDTSDLVQYVDNKVCKGETNISYRLNLQLQTYRLKLYNSKGKSGKDGVVRPMSFYILTNGEWGPGPDPKIAIKSMADYLLAEGYANKSQVSIEFISFATTAAAMSRINSLTQMDFGLDIVDCTRWTGNVLKMLKGPIDKSLFDHESSSSRNSQGPNQLVIPPPREESLVHFKDMINELA